MSTFPICFCPRAEQLPESHIADPGNTHNLLIPITATYTDGYSTAEIKVGIERAVTVPLARHTTPRQSTYCLPAIRDIPPQYSPRDRSLVRPIPATERIAAPAIAESSVASSPSGQQALVIGQAATSAIAELPAGPSRSPSTAPGSLQEITQSLQQSAWERSQYLDSPTVRDMAYLTLNFTAAARQGISGLAWTMEALRRVDSQVENLARYAHVIIKNRRWRGCDALHTAHLSQASLLQSEQTDHLPPQPITHMKPLNADHEAHPWEQALANLRLQITSRYAQDWLENRLLWTIPHGTVHMEFVVPQ